MGKKTKETKEIIGNNTLKLDNIPETLGKEGKQFNCDNCFKTFKTNSGLFKHKKKCDNNDKPKELIITDEADDEARKLKEELKKIYLNNPKLDLEKEIADNQTLLKIDMMEKEELEARILDAKLQFSKKIDQKISDGVLSVATIVMGNLLDIVNELEEEVKKDVVLREATQDVLSQNILIHLPNEIKMSGLFAVDVGCAYKKSLPRKQALKKAIDIQKDLETKEEIKQEEKKDNKN